MFIGGETQWAHSALPMKIPGWIVPVRENFSVNKRVCRKTNNWNCIKGLLSVFFSNFTFGFHAFHLKMLNIIDFWTGAQKKIILVVNNKTIECLYLGTIGQIITPWKFDVLKTSIFALEASLLGQIFVLRTSNFLGVNYQPIVPQQKHSIVEIDRRKAFVIEC